MPIVRTLARTALLAGLLLVTKGCTALLPQRAAETPEDIAVCEAFLADVDRAVEADGVTDAASVRIAEFPYLRTNRFWHALASRLLTRDQTQAWLEAMHALDLESRHKEILNLSASRLSNLGAESASEMDRDILLGRVRQCSQTLFDHHRYETDLRYRIKRRTVIPDEYQSWRRLVGLYPLASLPVARIAVENAEK